jgi:rare lipoprotein A (peptidoglycan hydrolase)
MRVNVRGPFVADLLLDLCRGAVCAIGLAGVTTVATVRVQ